MLAGPFRGFVALATFCDQTFNFAPLFLGIGIPLRDLARQEENSLFGQLENNLRAFFQIENIPDRSRHDDLPLRCHSGNFDNFHKISLHSYILTLPPIARIVNNIIETTGMDENSHLEGGWGKGRD